LQICFRRLPVDLFKNDIHKAIYKEKSQGNNISKFLVVELHFSKSKKIPDWEVITKHLKIEDSDEKYMDVVENRFHCEAYNCLSSLIKLTQTKEEIFYKFLFHTNRDNNEKLWQLLISEKFEYAFNVETNYSTKQINKVSKHTDVLSKGKKLIIDEIITDSFFHDAYGKTLKDTLLLDQKTLNLERPQDITKNIVESLEEFKTKSSAGVTFNDNIIEDDPVNKHPIMESLLIILDSINKAFPPKDEVLPTHLQYILSELRRDDCHLNIRIFFIKVIINKTEIFEKHFHQFIPIMLKYSTEKNNGGKGFHYFLRDIATLIASKPEHIKKLEFTKDSVEMISGYINHLVKLSGDTKNIIFRTNLKIITELMDKLKSLLYINKKTIMDMLQLSDSNKGSHIWKIAAIQVLASALDYDIPITDSELYNNSTNKFITSLERNEDVLFIVLKLTEHTRTPIQSACIELLAKIMSQYRATDKYFNTIYDYLENLSISKIDKFSINLIFRASLHYKTFINRKRIFNKAIVLFKNTNQNNRNLLFNTLNNYLDQIISNYKGNISTISLIDKSTVDDIYYNLYPLIDAIFVDPNDELIINLTQTVLLLLKVNEPKYEEGITRIILKMNKDIIRKKETTRQIYYECLIKIFEMKNFIDRGIILNLVIRNLEKETENELKSILITFLNKTDTMPLDPVERILFLFKHLTEDNIEEKLIQNITKLILILSGVSADYNLKIYEKSLSECQYRDLNINTIGYYLNRSQPVPPSVAIRSSMDEAYETIVNVGREQTQLGMLRSTQDLLSTLVHEHMNNSNNIDIVNHREELKLSKDNKAGINLSISSQDLFLSQHSSLVAVSEKYPVNVKRKFNLGTGLVDSPEEIINNTIDIIGTFKAPRPKKGKGYGSFLQENEMFYTPVNHSTDNKIRFLPDGSYREKKKHQESVKDALIMKWLNRQNNIRKKQIKLMRNYRIGDLPDIQIFNKDIIDPLTMLCDTNLEISSEIFLEIMTSLYKESLNSGRQFEIHNQIEKILKNYKIANYLIISCIHRFIAKIMSISDEYIPDLAIIKKSGLFTKNYHSTILILEESIINSSSTEKLKKKMLSNNNIADDKVKRHDINITDANKKAWVYLLNFYSKIKLSDYEIGLIQNFAGYENYFMKNKSDFLDIFSQLLTKPKEYINKNIDIANLLQTTFKINDGKIQPENQKYDKYDASLFIDLDLKEAIEDYSIKFCSNLGEWDNIAKYLKRNNEILADGNNFEENPERVENILKSWIYTEDNWKGFNSLLDGHLLGSYFTQNIFTYYMSLFYLIHRDYDQAMLYYERSKQNLYRNWLNLGIHSTNLQHEIIHKIQQIHEISEFLEFIRGNLSTNKYIMQSSVINFSNEGIKGITELFEKWLNRWPSYIYDDAFAFQEIFASRRIYFECFRHKFNNFEQIVNNCPNLDNFFPQSHIKISHNLFKKNLYDIAERHTKTALQIRKSSNISTAFLILPVLQTKYKILKIESSKTDNIGKFNENANKYDILIKVLNEKVKNVNFDADMREKLNILKIKLYLSIAYQLKLDNTSNKKYEEYFGLAMESFNHEVSKFDEVNLGTNYIKLLRPMIKFCERVIYHDENDIFGKNVKQIYTENCFKSLLLGDEKQVNAIPKLFDLLSKNTSLLGSLFGTYCSQVPSNFYLKWKNQIIAYINSNINKFLIPIVDNILANHPQSLFYPFSVISNYSEIFNQNHEKSELFKKLENYYSEYSLLNCFVESLDGLTNPEHRLKYWLDNIKEYLVDFINFTCDKDKTLEKIDNVIKIIKYEIVQTEKKLIGKKVGSYNYKYSKDVEKLINANVTMERFKYILGLSTNNISKAFGDIVEELMKVGTGKNDKASPSRLKDEQYSQGIERLSTYSEWLAQYECNEFNDPKSCIEIPSEDESNKIKIASFDQHMLILTSVRKPKKIVVFGNDEKSYSFLIKGCEDLRLDQRIMEIFRAFNEIMKNDSNCMSKGLKLNRFSVFPLTLKLGILEWIDNTQPMKSVIKYSMNKLFNNPDWDVTGCAPQTNKIKWLSNLTKDRNIAQQHYTALHMTKNQEVINAFKYQENLLPKTILKRGLEHYLSNPEEILTKRVSFIRNYSALCIACYILGIGDRHLENFLININNSQIYAIDFGISFGQGLVQLIPELIPFRFTNQIRNVVYPLCKRGPVRNTMIDMLSALKANKKDILDYCEVFVKEPLLEWVKVSRSKTVGEIKSSEGDIHVHWVPVKKLQIIDDKLSGVNPIDIMLEELKDTRHADKVI
jgi:DNA-dependent protein kinase catalytic subunit